MWLEELLSDPGLELALIAGGEGLRRRGPIRWAHISEIPDPTPWLEGGELLLTTGMGVRDSDELQRALIAGLDHRGCPGVGFGLGVCLDAVPEAMLEEAHARHLPLFTVPYEVPFIAVTKRVSREIFDEHYQTLRGAVDLHRQVLAAVLSRGGLSGILDIVGRAMPGFTAILFDYYGQVLAARQPRAAPSPPQPERLWPLVAASLGHGDREELSYEESTLTVAAVRLEGQVEAVLALLGRRPLLEHESLLLEQGLTGVTLELARGLSIREARRARVEALLDEVSDGQLPGQRLARHLERLEIDPCKGFRVLCLRPPPQVSQRSLAAVAEDVVATDAMPVVGRHDGAVFCIVSGTDGGRAAEIAAAVWARGWSDVAIGRSRVKDSADGLAAATREAAIAASASHGGDGIRDIADLGLAGLLAAISDSVAADAFCRQVLGPVLDHDACEGAHLTATLRSYLRHGCRPGAAAAELSVHRHTLSYRLDRIRELTGRDPRDGRHLVEFGLALEILARAPV